jgi:methionyl-tRNA formyltransferase
MTGKTQPKPFSVIFMGTPDFSVPALEALIHDPLYNVVCVYTQPPRPAGRGHRVIPSPIHQCADRHSIEVRHPLTLKTAEEQEKFRALNADIAIVAAYGLILPRPILESPTHGCLNIHASLLPRWRGAAPIQRAIEAGDKETGITLMQMDIGLDTGDMITKASCTVTKDTTAKTLHDQLSSLGATLLLKTLPDYLDGKIPATPQPEEGVTYAHKITKEEALLDWPQPASVLERKIRALTPFPGTWFLHKDQRIKIHSATVLAEKTDAAPGTVLNDTGDIACGDGTILRPTLLQKEGGKPLPLAEFLRGFSFKKEGV